MNDCKKSVDKKGIKLVVFYIKCPQVIEFQVYARNLKPQENTLV
ncbi:hypothetical protein HMPREF2141_02099 [Bacteroides uniformis]|jgi:hypothetical protein|nr:hypothetical protein HMPREF2141_02099 [Bacteroides uniformis]